MFDERELRQWLASEYPGMHLRSGSNGLAGIWQEDRIWRRYDFDDGDVVGFLEHGYSLVFDFRGRIFGGWIKDEMQRRDPRLWHNPGNAYHEAFILSKQADLEAEKRHQHARDGALRTWNVLKKNEKLMNRIGKWMEKGDMLRAGRELSLEELYRNAILENPAEMRSKDFARAMSR